MSKLHINQIEQKIRLLFEDLIDKSDIRDKDPDKEGKILTRCLCAFAIYNASECSAIEAAKAITDGAEDNGIDGVYFSEVKQTLYVVQSKWRSDGKGEPEKRDLLIFKQGLEDLFNQDFENFNDKIKAKASLIDEALYNYDTRYELIHVDTYEKVDLVESNIKPILDFVYSMNDNGDSNSEALVVFKRLNQSSVHKALSSQNQTNTAIDITLLNWGNIQEPYKAFYGSVSVLDIALWWKEFGENLFDKNIRKVLGKTDVNDEIEKTLGDDPSLFWYFNNGITIVAEKINKNNAGGKARDIGIFRLTNFSIVNGAQTVSTIGRYLSKDYDNTEIEDAKVNLRIIEIPNNLDLMKSVTRANNRQNRIEGIDFASQDPEQHRIKNELVLEGIDYILLRNQNYKPSQKSFNVQEATVALATINENIALAVQVKSQIGKFFENLDKGIYKEIFNKSVTGYEVYNSVVFVRLADECLSNFIKELPKKSGKSYGIRVHGNRFLTHMIARRFIKTDEVKFRLVDFDGNQLKNELTNMIALTEKYISQEYEDNVLATLFKNSTKCKHLESLILKDNLE